MEIPESLLNTIRTLKRPIIVAVSGLGGAGKSSFANKLAERLSAPVVGVDSFQKKGAFDIDFSLWEIMNYSRLEREVLVPFLKGENVSYGHFDASQEAVSHKVEVANAGLLIVEGVGLFRPELLKYFSYKVWVETPMEEAIVRGKKRDREVHQNPQDENWDGVWKKNDFEYLQTFKPQEAADFVFHNQ